jgi:formiminotetrahydrofolate cyclodeaminase
MGGFADRSLRDVLDEVAAQRPAPGGGCAAAWGCALSAGLVEMAASFTLARPRYAGVHHRMLDVRRAAAVARRRALEWAERDAEGYAPVLEALRLPRQHPERAERLRVARSNAAEIPLAVAEEAATVAALAAETARTGSEHLEGDAVTGAVMAEAACRAAGRLVEINLAETPDDPRLGRVAEAVRRAGAARDQALAAREEALR